MMQTEQIQKKRFVLTLRNQKGQVGIFVALIFQVIFVFFAMLVNVGLVVHHKINLQQSTDLAAYYGAMKQAEIMNVMAHVNYQIRQAWKLMAWRYRVLGTFGIENDNKSGTTPVIFPMHWPAVGGVKKPVYQGASYDFACPASAGADVAGLTISDIPFMCMGHNGFGDWISAATGDETFCKVNCQGMQSMEPFKIDAVPSVGTSTIYGNSMGQSINTAIGLANKTVFNVCNKLAPITTQMLALYYGNYIKDTTNRKNFIWMLTKNLGLSEDKMLDLEGNLVLDGVRKTLQNNLTEANLASMNANSITAFNGVKNFNSGGNSFAEGMMKEITFKRLMFFMIACETAAEDAQKIIKLKSLYQDDTKVDSIIKSQMLTLPGMDGATVQAITDLLEMNGLDNVNTIGYEKNPWVQVYYGVKASAEPKIPFLPLAKVKLHAISFAKPFGGTIGPRYFKTWNPGETDSSGRTDWINRTDINLPRRNTNALPSGSALKLAREYFFNYSTHLGDEESHGNAAADNKGGLGNTNIVAFYHNLLANKYGLNSKTSASSANKSQEPEMGTYTKPKNWPRYAEWYHLAANVGDPNYDPLAVDRTTSPAKNSYMRDIEISVVSPNQFDVTYYSIEPDFWRNYVREKLTPTVIAKIASNANFNGPVPIIPLDFGHKGATEINGIPPHFNVRNQMQVTHDLFKKAQSEILAMGTGVGSAGIERLRFALDVLATKQSSLLTGWTFLNLTTTNNPDQNGFTMFPAPGMGGPHSMLFGTCDDKKNPWSDSFGAPYDGDDNKPPAQGNCVTGGRTGYSVKLVSGDLLRSGISFPNLGGSGVDGPIINPVPDEFFNF